MKTSILAIFAILILNVGFANNNSQADSSKSKISHSIFIEAFGNNIIGSINYRTTIVLKNKLFTTLRIGGLYFPFPQGRGYKPLEGLNTEITMGYGTYHSFNTGAGLSHMYNDAQCPECNTPYISEELFLTFKPIEYKFQRRSSGIFIATSILYFIRLKQYSTYIRTHPEIAADFRTKFLWASLSLGYTFRR